MNARDRKEIEPIIAEALMIPGNDEIVIDQKEKTVRVGNRWIKGIVKVKE